MSLYQLIDQKVIDYGEVIVCLFDHCNLRCVFCPQDHDSILGASRDEIMSKVPGIVSWINNNTRSTYFKLHIMGGELFQDKWIEAGFLDIYQEFMDAVRDGVPAEKQLVHNFVTNLVFDNTEPVMKFLQQNNLKVSISYDSSGRFNGRDLETFIRNTKIFKERIEMCSMVLTRQNMLAIIDGDAHFDYIYQHFTCDWDSLIPVKTGLSEKLMPSETEMLTFYKHLVDNYPKCLNISYFTEPSYENKMSCTRGNSYTVLHDNTNPAGCSGSVLIRDAASPEPWSPIIVEKFFKQYNCFECEFYKRCPFTCFIKNDYKKIVRDLGECVFKETFKYVELKKAQGSIS